MVLHLVQAVRSLAGPMNVRYSTRKLHRKAAATSHIWKIESGNWNGTNLCINCSTCLNSHNMGLILANHRNTSRWTPLGMVPAQ